MLEFQVSLPMEQASEGLGSDRIFYLLDFRILQKAFVLGEVLFPLHFVIVIHKPSIFLDQVFLTEVVDQLLRVREVKSLSEL